MPYFVYRIATDPDTGHKDLTHVDTVDHFKGARQMVRSLRARDAAGAPEDVRMIFANSQTEAERLLTAPREERVIGED